MNQAIVMEKAGPSKPAKMKKAKKPQDAKLKTKKVRRANEAKAIADLEQAALHFVSRLRPGSVLLLINTD